MSAVEFLLDALFTKTGIEVTKENNPPLFEVIEKAKEMDKEQRIKDIDFGHGIPSWVNVNYEAYFELSNKSGNEAEKLPTFELTEEGEIDGIKLDFDFDGLLPAEKAHEIFEKMLNAEDPMGNYPMCFDTAKQCALIAVDEVLKLHKKVALNTLYFYVEVRKEILNYKKPE